MTRVPADVAAELYEFLTVVSLNVPGHTDGAGAAGTFDGGERDAEAEDIDVVIDPDDMPDGSVRVDPQMLSERSLGFAITPGSSTFDLTLVHSGSGNVTVTVTADVEMLVACESSENMVESSETTTIDAL